jgi:hypothetical protein
MSNLNMGGFNTADAAEGQVNLPMAIVGAAAGAFALGAIYGIVGRVIGEYSYVAFLVGAASGVGAMKLGKGRSIVAGAAAAVLTLIAIIGAKLIIGDPSGAGWVAYHTTLFDIIFCYLAAPAAAFFAAGTNAARGVLNKLPF